MPDLLHVPASVCSREEDPATKLDLAEGGGNNTGTQHDSEATASSKEPPAGKKAPGGKKGKKKKKGEEW